MPSFHYHCTEDWPPLAWLAVCREGAPAIEVYHGPRVETHEDWFCEAVWDAPYAQGGFDQTDLVFGSGGRRREEEVVFVSAGTPVDRLQSLRTEQGTLVSNSLAALLAVAEATVDPAYPHYARDLGTITNGIDDHRRTLRTSAGPARLTYFRNLTWDGQRLAEVDKPRPHRDFSSYERYRAFMDAALGRLAGNLRAEERAHPFEMMGTLSSGYDSPAVTALVQPHGLTRAITFTTARCGKNDDGQAIAEQLGVRPLRIPRDAWRDASETEVPFIATDGKGEDVIFKGAEQHLAGTVLFTGYNGSGAWMNGRETRKYFARNDRSGLSLSEYRLWTGFIHCPVPFMGALQVEDLRAISNAPEMEPWDVSGSYDQPTARRIVEEAGVARGSFATEKKAASFLLHRERGFLSAPSRREYMRWLEDHAEAWTKQGRTPPHSTARIVEFLQPIIKKTGAIFRKLAPYLPVLSQQTYSLGDAIFRKGSRSYLFPYLFPWAMERAKERYRPHPTETFRKKATAKTT